MDRGAWQATYSPWGRKESDTIEQLRHTHMMTPKSLPGLNIQAIQAFYVLFLR